MSYADLNSGSGTATRLIVESGLLTSPFVLVDIGCRDGVSARWDPVGDSLLAYGFDVGILEASAKPNHHFRKLAIGEYDGECGLETGRNPHETRVLEGGSGTRISKLDTLWDSGDIPRADFIKIDVEGHEPEVLTGAARYLRASNLIGAEVETNFGISPKLPESHFCRVYGSLLQERLVLADLATSRPPAACNALFCRNFPEESRIAQSYPYRTVELAPSLDALLKCLIVYDLFGLPEPACKLLDTFCATLECLPYQSRIRRTAGVPMPTDPMGPAPPGARYEQYLPHLGFGILSSVRNLFLANRAYFSGRRRR